MLLVLISEGQRSIYNYFKPAEKIVVKMKADSDIYDNMDEDDLLQEYYKLMIWKKNKMMMIRLPSLIF
jgi:hypothetical protein